MRKLYTQYTDSETNTPFMVTFEGNQVQACANDGDTITIGSTEYVRVTDGSGHDVKAVILNSGDETPHKLIVRLGEGTTHDLCYIKDDGIVSSTSIQVTDIQPTPQETVITYTRDYGLDEYETDTQIEGEIPDNAYLTWEMVNRPTEPIPVSHYVMSYASTDYGGNPVYLIAAFGDKFIPPELHISTGYVDEHLLIDFLRVDNDNLVECIKSVEWREDGVTVEIEDIENGTTRTAGNSYATFMHVVDYLNQTEGSSAIQNFGHYLDFQFNGGHGEDRTPEIKLHIPNT